MCSRPTFSEDLIAAVEQISGQKYDGGGPFPRDCRSHPKFVVRDRRRGAAEPYRPRLCPPKDFETGGEVWANAGVAKAVLGRHFPRLVSLMGEDFPELRAAEGRIGEVLTLEEEAFIRTLTRGGQLSVK